MSLPLAIGAGIAVFKMFEGTAEAIPTPESCDDPFDPDYLSPRCCLANPTREGCDTSVTTTTTSTSTSTTDPNESTTTTTTTGPGSTTTTLPGGGSGVISRGRVLVKSNSPLDTPGQRFVKARLANSPKDDNAVKSFYDGVREQLRVTEDGAALTVTTCGRNDANVEITTTDNLVFKKFDGAGKKELVFGKEGTTSPRLEMKRKQFTFITSGLTYAPATLNPYGVVIRDNVSEAEICMVASDKNDKLEQLGAGVVKFIGPAHRNDAKPADCDEVCADRPMPSTTSTTTSTLPPIGSPSGAFIEDESK